MQSPTSKVNGSKAQTIAHSASINSESLYQNLIGEIWQSAKTCEVMEVMGLTNNGVTGPQPSPIFGEMMGFSNIPISWEELYYGHLQFNLPTDLLTINIKDGIFEQHLQPIAADTESLDIRLTKSVHVLLKDFKEEQCVLFGKLKKTVVMALHGLDYRRTKLLSDHGLELQKRKAVMKHCIDIQKCMALSVSPGSRKAICKISSSIAHHAYREVFNGTNETMMLPADSGDRLMLHTELLDFGSYLKSKLTDYVDIMA